jgi:beta-galactosidase/beta-glucuronidase
MVFRKREMCVKYLVMMIAVLACRLTAYAEDKWIRVIDLERQWRFSIGDNKKWADPAYQDGSWENIDVPGNWEDEGFNGYDGYAWYRISFDGAELKNRNGVYSLFLGYIDDVDEVYLNGKKIGSTGSFPPHFQTAYNAKRNYFIPNEFVRFQGKNVIAVRVFDSEIEGGIVSGDVGIFTSKDDEALALNLRGQWDFALGLRGYRTKNFSPTPSRTPPENLNWEKVTLPSQWENHGYPHYDGSAWYRKQFTLPKELQGEDLVLLLGKIDDYDQTYLNGKLVGATNRHDQLRIYHVNAEVVSAGVNLLLIYVEDTGGAGGLWEGPVGIMKQSQFTRFIRYRD